MKKQLTEVEFVDWWLEKYHNTNTEEVKKKHNWDDNKDHSREFYETYQVTQEQYDEWYDWAIKRVQEYSRCGKESARRKFVFTHLNVAPSIKK